MNETEIAKMIVSLLGDGSSFQGMCEEAIKGTEETAEAVEKEASRIEKFGSAVQTFLGVVAQALGAASITSWLKDSLHEFDEAEAGVIKLEAAIRSNGGNVEVLSKRYQDLASDLQKVTTMSDDAIISLLATAETFGVSGSKAEKAAKDAINLAAATGGAAESMIRLTAAMSKGDIKTAMRFARMIPQLRGIRDESEFAARFQTLLATGMEVVAKEADTTAGMIKTLTNLYGDFKEEIGETVAKAIKPLLELLRQGVDWLGALSDETKQTIATVAILTATVLGLSAAMTTAWFLFNTFTGGMGLWIAGIGLAVSAVAGLIVSIGGVGNVLNFLKETGTTVFNAIKEAALAAWEWTKPVRQAIGSLLDFIWETSLKGWEIVKKAAIDVWESIMAVIKPVWDAITGGAIMSATAIRDELQAAILFVEYSLRHVESVASIVWLTLKLGWISFTEDFVFFFDTTLPELFDWFVEQAPNIFMDVFDSIQKMIENRFHNIATLFTNLIEILSGDREISGLFDGLKNELDGVGAKFTELPKLTKRGITDAEKAIGSQLMGEITEFSEGWDQFYADKMAEFAAGETGAAFEQAQEEEGQDAGEAFNKGLAKEVKQMDAVLTGSAEALARIADYRDKVSSRVANSSNPKMGAIGDVPQPKRMTAQDMNPGGAPKDTVEHRLLTEIRNELKTLNTAKAGQEVVVIADGEGG